MGIALDRPHEPRIAHPACREKARPKNLDLELGAAHFIRAGFAVDAPDGRDDPSTLIYTQVTGTI